MQNCTQMGVWPDYGTKYTESELWIGNLKVRDFSILYEETATNSRFSITIGISHGAM
jgi:hypothetical protein